MILCFIDIECFTFFLFFLFFSTFMCVCVFVMYFVYDLNNNNNKFDGLLRAAIDQLTNSSLTDTQWLQASLPIKDGGLGVIDGLLR